MPAAEASPKDTAEPEQAGAAGAQNSAPVDPDFEEKVKRLEHEEEAKGPGPKGGWTSLLCLSIFAASVGGTFQLGFHIVVMSIPMTNITSWLENNYAKVNRCGIENENPFLWNGALLLLFSAGGVLGALVSWCILDRCGRKGAMILNNVLSLIAVIFLGSARIIGYYYPLLFGRFVSGFTAGVSSVALPVYLHEISPAYLRGRIGCLNDVVVAFGMICAMVAGNPLLLGTEQLWPFILVLPTLPFVIQFVTLPLCPESPMYNLVIKGYEKKAERDLIKLRRSTDVTVEMDALRDEASSLSLEKITAFSVFDDQFIWPLIMVTVITMSRPISDILFTTVAERIPSAAHFAMTDQMPSAVAFHILCTLVPFLLVDHPKCGRRLLLVIGLSGMAFSAFFVFAVLTALNHTEMVMLRYFILAGQFTYGTFYGIGPGPISWFITVELFDTNARGSAQSVVVTVKWLCNLIFYIALYFFKSKVETSMVFIVSGLLLSTIAVFVFVFLPDLSGRTPAEVYEELKLGKSRFARARALQGDE